MKRLVIDLDRTIAGEKTTTYEDVEADMEIVARMRDYKAMGFEIVIHTSRNMRTFENSLGKIVANTVPVVIDWLKRHDIPYDEIWVGKPWCGTEGFYVDDRAIRPDEFKSMSHEEIIRLIGVSEAGNEAAADGEPG